MQNRAWGNECRMTLVCVDDYQDSILRGRLYNPYYSINISTLQRSETPKY